MKRFVLAVLAMSVLGAGAASSAVVAATPVRSSNGVAATHASPAVAAHRASATRLRAVKPSLRVRVSISLRHDRAGLRRMATMVGRPGSKQRYRSIREAMRQHGATAADIQVVRAWARERGLTAQVSLLRHRVVVSGSARQIMRAFNVRLFHYRDRMGRTYVAASTPVTVPPAIAGAATSVAGIGHEPGTSGRTPVSVATGGPAAATAHPSYAPGTSPCATHQYVAGVGMTPFGLATQYGFDQVGSGADLPAQTVAIIEFNQLATPTDVAKFQSCRFGAGAAPITVQQRNLPGAAANNSGAALASGANGEAQLDTQLLAALAPANTTVVVLNVANGDSNSWPDVLEAAAALPNLSVVSISYGPDELCMAQDVCSSTSAFTQADSLLTAAATAGVNVFVSSGDQGSQGPPEGVCSSMYPMLGFPGDANVNWPASSPDVIAVGGTMWSSTTRTPDTEQAWWQGIGSACPYAGGGGQSQLYARPPWQKSAGAGIPGQGRLVPDVSVLAGAPSYLTVQNGALAGMMGTSASAPLMAAVALRLNAESLAAGDGPIGFLGPQLYTTLSPVAGSFTDLTQGTNDLFSTGCCTARTGFDMVFGIGVPNFGNRAPDSWLQTFTD